MKRCRLITSSFLIVASIIVFAAQVQESSAYAKHKKALIDAKSLSGTATVQPLGGTASTITFTFAKPHKLSLESEESLVLCDGKNITQYNKKTKKYTVEQYSDASFQKLILGANTWGWNQFFDLPAIKDLEGKAGNKRSFKGKKVEEFNLSWPKDMPGSGTLLISDTDGYAIGYTFKSGDAETIVIADSLTFPTSDIEDKVFAFVAPPGSEKVEAMIAPTASGYAAVQAILNRACMPCHGSANRKSGIDLSSYDAIMSTGSVSAGSPDSISTHSRRIQNNFRLDQERSQEGLRHFF